MNASNGPQPCVGIIEDDDSLRRSLGRLLRAAGFQAVAYSSAEQLLADDKRPRFDCLIVDIQLGGMSGIELSRQLAASGSVTPVVFNTVCDERDLREKALRAGGAAFLQKTDLGEKMLMAIQNAIGANALRENRSSAWPRADAP
jgi:FixJ family two-component response regulator